MSTTYTSTGATATHQLTQASLIRLLQIGSPLLTALLSGLSLSTSTLLVPRLLESPSPLMLKQWHATFTQGRNTIVPLSGAAAAGFAFLAYTLRNAGSVGGSNKARAYLLSAALCVGIVPYTVVVMMPTNLKLMKKMEEMELYGTVNGKAKEVNVVVEGRDISERDVEEVLEEAAQLQRQQAREQERGAKQLVDHWATLNLGRTAFLAIAAVVGLSVSL
ncbi:hypothetical protein B0H66DRAFT_539769 [Apodospora peruviana]|uniref:Uncharacterized protein n=1 Tax=Apodospora peruviana TaxID=516989 RepID=A0AAE0IPF4_9PEZI|nr:hypothetical protein B0H66DRAFT_539769 [Apodospora peruviana]